jgi:signal transduction histidine kinase
VELVVSDDGRGIPGGPPERGFHFGLSGMRERARALGTRLEVESAPGHGATIRVRWSGRSDESGAPEA